MKTCLVIRHSPAEGIAGFRQPIEAAGYAIRLVSPAELAGVDADAAAADLLVTMGGTMGVYERDLHPWIGDELCILRARIEAGRPLLGVCLGAQMIAAALGRRVFRGARKEVGFAAVALGKAGRASPLRHLGGVPVLHWHGDSFDLPDDVELLASSALYRHQAFRRGGWLLALQCHPEMGEDRRFEAWVDHGAAYMADAGKDAAGLRDEHRRLGPGALAAGRRMVAEWLEGVAD